MPDGAEASMYPLPYGLKDEDYDNYDRMVKMDNWSDGAISASHNFEFPDDDHEDDNEWDTMTETKPTWIIPANLPIKAANELGSWGVVLAIYGVPGVGKTTEAANLAYSDFGKPALIVDAEGGARAVTHIPDLFVLNAANWSHIRSVENMFSGNDLPFQTIVFDNMSEISNMALRAVVGDATSMPQIQHYGRSNTEILNFVRTWRDIARRKAINVIFIIWESPERDEATQAVKRDLGFTPSLQKLFPGIVDIVGHMTANDKGLRNLAFNNSTRTAAKFRRSQSEQAMKIPLSITFGPTEHPIADIVGVLRGGQDWPTSKYQKYQEPNRQPTTT